MSSSSEDDDPPEKISSNKTFSKDEHSCFNELLDRKICSCNKLNTECYHDFTLNEIKYVYY